MTIQAIREFMNRHHAAASGLGALGAALDAKASGAPLDAALAARVDELLSALGAGDALKDVSVQEAAPLLAEIRFSLGMVAKLPYAHTRGTSWGFSDPLILQGVGEFSRMHAIALTRGVIPALGIGARVGARGAAFLDIGVGVAGTAIAMAEQWPELRIVGIDVWQPSLALARENVEHAGMRDRIELREQGAENIEDDKAFDLAWLPTPFIPERVIPQALERTLQALRPDGWIVLPCIAGLEAMEPAGAAAWRLRAATWGGPLLPTSQWEKMLVDKGFVDVRTLPSPPGVPVGMVVGRRKSA